MFVRFGSIWGSAWTSQFANGSILEAVKREWELALARFTDDQVLTGINKAIRGYKKFPPKLPEFVDCCEPEPLYYQPIKMLPPPKPDTALAERTLAECRKILSRRRA